MVLYQRTSGCHMITCISVPFWNKVWRFWVWHFLSSKLVSLDIFQFFAKKLLFMYFSFFLKSIVFLQVWGWNLSWSTWWCESNHVKEQELGGSGNSTGSWPAIYWKSFALWSLSVPVRIYCSYVTMFPFLLLKIARNLSLNGSFIRPLAYAIVGMNQRLLGVWDWNYMENNLFQGGGENMVVCLQQC